MIFLPLTVAEDDWAGWKILHGALGEQIELVGDDLFVTNVKYIQRGIDENLANSALIKLNQIGSLSETFDAVQLCHDNNWGTFISHRSGETVDSFIADMTVAMRAGHLKTGAPCRGERIEKYNQLMRIEDELGYSGGMMKAHVFVISMLTGIVVTYAVLLLGCLFIDKTLPTVDVVILSLVVGASAQQLSRVLMSINRTFPYLACSQRI